MRVSREVILAGGAFNTPQLLDAVRDRPAGGARTARHRSTRSTVPASAANLQDRYEVGVVYAMRREVQAARGLLVRRARSGRDRRTNASARGRRARASTPRTASLIAVIQELRRGRRRAGPDRVRDPGLLQGLLPGLLEGASPRRGTSSRGRSSRRTRRTRAAVVLPALRRSARHRRLVNFRYFEEGDGHSSAPTSTRWSPASSSCAR